MKIISKEKFLLTYWRQYLMLEDEFMNTIKYVTIDEYNYKTYSSEYLKLLLQICSEIETTLNAYCSCVKKLRDDNSSTNMTKINKLEETIHSFERENKIHESFNNQTVICLCGLTNEKLHPFSAWYITGDTPNKINKTPQWWDAYNDIKHYRKNPPKNSTKSQSNDDTSNFILRCRQANLENTLTALAALYQIMLNFFDIINEDNADIKIPMRGSRLFKLSSQRWDPVCFYKDYALYIKNGNLQFEEHIIY